MQRSRFSAPEQPPYLPSRRSCFDLGLARSPVCIRAWPTSQGCCAEREEPRTLWRKGGTEQQGELLRPRRSVSQRALQGQARRNEGRGTQVKSRGSRRGVYQWNTAAREGGPETDAHSPAPAVRSKRRQGIERQAGAAARNGD